MTFREQLIRMEACQEAVQWVGEWTLEYAWNNCRRGDWMAWLTYKLNLDSRAAAADMAERVWHLVEPESQLACAWAIDCARRGADDDEMDAARAAAWAAARDAAGAAAWDAAGAARDAAGYAAWAAAGYAAWAAAGDAERAAQADIMRDHFTWQQIAAAMKEQGYA